LEDERSDGKGTPKNGEDDNPIPTRGGENPTLWILLEEGGKCSMGKALNAKKKPKEQFRNGGEVKIKSPNMNVGDQKDLRMEETPNGKGDMRRSRGSAKLDGDSRNRNEKTRPKWRKKAIPRGGDEKAATRILTLHKTDKRSVLTILLLHMTERQSKRGKEYK